uniref:Major facilitator superfamily (MFS) profile domain-containing protein n=1 Tax=Haptolina brevifila TaxID=156173 RepID=A0A7S2G5Q6_9EUKA|mmetsp:Transcript_27422/g.55200  ORF Transcript_27422/g.55200 Transcript_27422/m.55200 type:complete len:431 (+) Transcript_27422:85-1377(+)
MDYSPLVRGSSSLVQPLAPSETLEQAASKRLGNSRGLLLSFYLALLFSQYILVTFLSPFLPDLATRRGISQTVVGLIMAMDSLASTIFAPIVGFQTKRVGVRAMIAVGLVFSSLACGLMAAVPTVFTSAGSLATAFLVARFLMGIGGAMVETASYGDLLHVFKDSKGKVMAAGETVVGLGCIAGPPFGGLMYQLSEQAFWLPCAVFGAFPAVLLLGILFLPRTEARAAQTGMARPSAPNTTPCDTVSTINQFIHPSMVTPCLSAVEEASAAVSSVHSCCGAAHEEGVASIINSPSPSISPSISAQANRAAQVESGGSVGGGGFLGLLLSTPFLITLIGVILGSSALGFIDPVLAPYMKATYGLDAGIAGIFFMITGLTYILTAMVAGALVDNFGPATAPRQEYKLKLTQLVGFLILTAAYQMVSERFALQ